MAKTRLEDPISIREQLQREAVFSSLGRHLSVANSPKEAARVIVDAAQNLIGWDVCSFGLHTRDLGRTEPILQVEIVNSQWVEVTPNHTDSETAFFTRQAITDGARLVDRGSRPEEPGITCRRGNRT